MRATAFRSTLIVRAALVGLVSLGLSVVAAGALEAPDKFVVYKTPRDIGEVAFSDEKGQSMRLADFRGQVILLNIWATWCAPCREEMPTLDRLQASLGGSDFRVLALSVDRAGLAPVRKFLTEIDVRHLEIYIDQTSKSMFELRARGLPTTLLIDREGREIGRLVGPTEWDTEQMIRFLSAIIARPG